MFNAIRRFIGRQLLRRNSWLFALGLVFAAYALCQMTGQPSAATFFPILGGLLLVFGPLLVYVYWREFTKVAPKPWVDIVIFGIYGAAVALLGPHIQSLPFTNYVFTPDSLANQQSVRIIAVGFLLLEAWLRWGSSRKESRRFSAWLLQRNSIWVPLLLLELLIILLLQSSNIFTDQLAQAARGQKIAYATGTFFQAYLTYLPYFGLFLLHHRYLFPKLYPKRGLLIYAAATLGLLLFFTPLQAMLTAIFPDVMACKLHPVAVETSPFASSHLVLSAAFLLLTLPYSIVVEWYRKQAAIEQLESERNRTELALLKEQINPHFFFNTLNNLYAMSLGEDKRTPEVILQLSELMRYVIYRGKAELVPLTEELKYLQDYLDLQSIRLRKQVDIQFNIQDVDASMMVPPLLFIILVENAFKHGIEPAEEEAFLHLECLATSSVIKFECRNSIDPNYEPQKTGGLGLKNLSRRLELRFPGRYRFRTEKSGDSFLATLLIPKS